jgi:hypothetical protein
MKKLQEENGSLCFEGGVPGPVCRKKNFAPLVKFLYLDMYEIYSL